LTDLAIASANFLVLKDI